MQFTVHITLSAMVLSLMDVLETVLLFRICNYWIQSTAFS